MQLPADWPVGEGEDVWRPLQAGLGVGQLLKVQLQLTQLVQLQTQLGARLSVVHTARTWNTQQ